MNVESNISLHTVRSRYTIWNWKRYLSAVQKLGSLLLVLEYADSLSSYGDKARKLIILEKVSVKLNVLRFLIRLMKETKTFDTKKYIALQVLIDEIGRMTGGWMRSLVNK